MIARTKVLAGAIGLGVAAGLTTSAVAAIPDSNTHVITACLHKPTGMIRLIDKEAGETCGAGFTEINWNQVGPTGPAGPKGDKGDPGEPASFTTYIANNQKVLSSGEFSGFMSAPCDEGDKVLSGGYTFNNGEHDVAIVDNSPSFHPADNIETWNAAAWNHSSANKTFHVYSLCLNR